LKELLLKLVNLLHLYPLFNGFTKDTATIFMLHHIGDSSEHNENALSTLQLDQYFNYLKKHSYNVISLSHYIRALINHEDISKAVVFTVDDGYRDFYLNAYPVFKKYNYSATIFLTGDFIEGKLFFWWDTIEYIFKETKVDIIDFPQLGLNKVSLVDLKNRNDCASQVTVRLKKVPNADKLAMIEQLVRLLNVDISSQPRGIYEPLSWTEIREMKEHGIEFHPHTRTHPILSNVSVEQQKDELTTSKAIIEDKLNSKADIFCYPNGDLGDFNEDTISILKSTGYIAAVIGVSGFYHTKMKNDMYRIPRFAIPDGIIWFKQYICGLEYLKRKLLS
jgi:peptidoglycan/xylan/chitin deacetylase (PgdA/CDA1 family)